MNTTTTGLPPANIQNACTTAMFMAQGLGYGERLRHLGALTGSGHIELMSSLSGYAMHSEMQLMAREDEEYPGVFDYEVSEEFGRWYGQYIIDRRGTPPADLVARAKLDELIARFFGA